MARAGRESWLERQKSGETRIEYQLALGNAHFVHLEKGLDLFMEGLAQVLQSGSERAEQSAGHTQMTVGTPRHFHAKNLFQPCYCQIHGGRAAMSVHVPNEGHPSQIRQQSHMQPLKLHPAIQRGIRLGCEHTLEMSVDLSFTDLHKTGAFDHGLLQTIHKIARLGIPLLLLRRLDRGRAMRDPGCPCQGTERQRQQ